MQKLHLKCEICRSGQSCNLRGVWPARHGFAERFKKVHPDMDINQTFENFEKLRTIGSLEMLGVEDVVTPAK